MLELSGLRFGLIGLFCLAFLFLPIARGSVLLRLVDIPFEHATKYHVWLGHLTMFLFTLHGLFYVIAWAMDGRLLQEVSSHPDFCLHAHTCIYTSLHIFLHKHTLLKSKFVFLLQKHRYLYNAYTMKFCTSLRWNGNKINCLSTYALDKIHKIMQVKERETENYKWGKKIPKLEF